MRHDRLVGGLLKGWGLIPRGTPLRLPGGLDNLNLRVATDQGDVVVRRYDVCMHERARHELDLVQEVAARDYPTPPPMPTRSGRLLRSWKGRPVAVFPCVPGSTPGEYTPQLAELLGSLLGRLHKVTGSLDLHVRRSSYPKEIARACQHRRFDHLGGAGAWYQALQDFSTAHGVRFRKLWPTLPSGLVHHDLHRHNLLIDGQKTTVLDFGECCVAPLVVDLARTFHYMAGESPGFRLPLPLREAVLQGYQGQRPLSEPELSSLPVMFEAANLVDALRFFAAPPSEILDTKDCRSFAIYRANRIATLRPHPSN